MTEPRVEAGDRALETARKQFEKWAFINDVPLGRTLVFTDGHATAFGDYTDPATRLAWSAWQALESAMNAQERELRAKIKPMLDNLHTKPQPETGAWWRGECESNCHACTIERLLAERGEGR